MLLAQVDNITVPTLLKQMKHNLNSGECNKTSMVVAFRSKPAKK